MTNKPLISGVIAEFNPLHRGHHFLLTQAKKSSPGGLVVVMSGNFVQRGEPAAFYKWPRAMAAIRCGADLVLELPVGFSTAGAERFCEGAVATLDSLGCVDKLFFGSEWGEIRLLQTVAATLLSREFEAAVKEELRLGISFAAARQAAIAKLLGTPAAHLIKEPNNILGIEYCKALLRLGSQIQPKTIQRIGAPHDAIAPLSVEPIASASQIRRQIANREPFSLYVPKPAADLFIRELKEGRAPASLHPVETAILARLRTMSRQELSHLPDISEGLENRIQDSIKTSVSLEQLISSIKSKRYSHARIRRILLAAFLGLTNQECSKPPAYLRILAFNEKGREILRLAKRTATLPIIANWNDVASLNAEAKAMFQTECRATDLYALCTPVKGPCGLEMTCAYWERKDFFGHPN